MLLLHARDSSFLYGGTLARVPLVGGAPREILNDVEWADWILFFESGEGGGPKYAVYLRNTDGSPAIRLGEGTGLSLSPDGQWALSRLNVVPSPLVLYPAGVGEMRQLKDDGLDHMAAAFLPDGKQFVFTGTEPGHGARLYLESLDDAKPHPFSMEGVGSALLSPDATRVAARGPDQKVYLFPVAGGDPKLVAGVQRGEFPTAWSSDGRSLFVMARGQIPARCFVWTWPRAKERSGNRSNPRIRRGLTRSVGFWFPPTTRLMFTAAAGLYLTCIWCRD